MIGEWQVEADDVRMEYIRSRNMQVTHITHTHRFQHLSSFHCWWICAFWAKGINIINQCVVAFGAEKAHVERWTVEIKDVLTLIFYVDSLYHDSNPTRALNTHRQPKNGKKKKSWDFCMNHNIILVRTTCTYRLAANIPRVRCFAQVYFASQMEMKTANASFFPAFCCATGN